jgi:hypothetical protein
MAKGPLKKETSKPDVRAANKCLTEEVFFFLQRILYFTPSDKTNIP